MATPEQLVQLIRFGLDTLGERNGHHEFEALCLGLARRRVVSNLLPATGPVSAGGDQGRDAESHWTNLPNEVPGSSLFVSLASTETVVLACTIQRSRIPDKIRNDLSSICGQGSPVRRVVFFTVTAVAAKKRHELQAEAHETYGVDLDIWDGQGIALHLAEPDLFHLAVQYLQIPSEIGHSVPEAESGLPPWYIEDRERWRARVEPASTYGELIDLRRPLRYATFHVEARSDLADWIGYARALLAAAPASDVGLRARYEIAVATLRGTNTLLPADDLVRGFFTAVLSDTRDTGLLQDGVVLLQYCWGAFLRRITHLTQDDLLGWHRALRERVSTLLTDDPFPNAEASLLALSARLALMARMDRLVDTAPEDLATPAQTTERVLTQLDTEEPLHLNLEGVELVDLDAGMADLERLSRCLENARLYPAEEIADYFELLAPLLTNHPHYPTVRDALDEAIARVQGEAAKADRCRNRAVRFLETGRLLEALKEIHDAKVNWWHGETLHGALLSLLLVAHIYSQLQLPLAAKQYALTAATVASSIRDEELSSFVPRGILTASLCDYQAGNWLSATEMAAVGTRAQGTFVDDPWNMERHEPFADMVAQQAIILRAAREIRPRWAARIEGVTRQTGLDQLVEPILDGAEHPVLSEAEWTELAISHGVTAPLFSDAGPVRTYRWTALGMKWTVTGANEHRSVLAAERFAAAAQIVLVELAVEDALLLRGDVSVEVRLAPPGETRSGGPRCEPVPDNNASRWVVFLPPADAADVSSFQTDLASPLVFIIITNSLLPQQAFMDVIHRAFERGLWHKISMGRPYDEAADLLMPEIYEQLARLQTEPVGAEEAFAATGSSCLSAPTHPAPGYDRAASLEAVRNRYRSLPLVMQRTWARLRRDSAFLSVVEQLREQGWLDWHVLTAVANHVANQRLRWENISLPLRTPEEAARANAVMRRGERETDPQLPAVAFNEASLKFALQGSVLATLVGLGLQSHQPTPDFGAIFEFLGSRYGYWSDDVPHDDLFERDATP